MVDEKCPRCGKIDPAGLRGHLWRAHGISLSQQVSYLPTEARVKMKEQKFHPNAKKIRVNEKHDNEEPKSEEIITKMEAE
jgi:hypothetical protein